MNTAAEGPGRRVENWRSVLICVAMLVVLPSVTASAPDAWRWLRATMPVAPTGLPLVVVPARKAGNSVAMLIVGDGGWAPADQSLAEALAGHGVSVVGLNSPVYLIHEHTPNEVARDVARAASYYLRAWGRDRLIIIGYSRGADLAPFAVSRLPAAVRDRVSLLVLLGPASWSGFQFHLVDLFRNVRRAHDLPLWPEIAKLSGTPVLCVSGRQDPTSICPQLGVLSFVRVLYRDGPHGLSPREGSALANAILSPRAPYF